MPNFLRHIRKYLLAENKASKYLLYAFGEIILVVIGILIALQINNWNDSRKELNIEFQILNELKNGLTIDRNKMADQLVIIKKDIARIKRLDSLMDNPDISSNPSLDSLFGSVYGVRTINLNKGLYEDLKSVGLRIIIDDEIRSRIINLFEDNYAFLNGLFDIEMHVNELTRPYYLQNFHNIYFHVSSTPNDFNKVWKDNYYRNIVQYRGKNLESNQLRNYARTVKDIEVICSLIEKYLKK